MSEQGPPTGPGKPQGPSGPRKHLNGHANGHASGQRAPQGEPGVVVPFPRKPSAPPAWRRWLLGPPSAGRFGALLGWLAILGFAGLFWGVSKDGVVDAIDVFAGLFGVLTALWFHRSR